MSFAQRSHARVPGDTTVIIELLDESGTPVPDQEELVCIVSDVSEGGMSFRTNEPPPSGSKANLTIVMGSSYVFTEGVIRRVSKPDEDGESEVGAEFTYISPDSLRELQKTIEHRRPTGL